MGTVPWMPWAWAITGCAALALVAAIVPLPAAAWAAGVGYLVVSSFLLSRALRRSRATRLGPANAITATRSALVGIVTALTFTALAVAGTEPGGATSAALFVPIVACALALDAVDGFVARRTHSETALGARFDMEVDAFLLLVLCVYDARLVGWWVLSIGLMRYAFVAAGWMLPWMRRALPVRYWRKVVTAACGIGLTLIATGLLPAVPAVILAAAALALLIESFGRDLVWLARMNLTRRRLVSSGTVTTESR